MTAFRACSIPDCANAILANGLCSKHYNRLRRHGDPLVTKCTPKGEPKKFYQEVVLAYEGDECLIWPYNTVNGYGSMWHYGRTRNVSRVLCEDVHGPAPTPKHEGAHSCGKGHLGCVAKRHLSWKTQKENQADKLVHGTHNRGERSASAKITETQAREILSLKGKETQVVTAKRFGVSNRSVSNIQRRESWAWLQPEQPSSHQQY
jgi:hypothetical protein